MIGPIVVGVVWVVGLVQSAFLLVRKPWSNRDGAWSVAASRVSDTSLGSPALLLITRAATLAFALYVVANQIASVGIISYKFYTVWSFCLLIVFFAFATAASWKRCFGKTSADAGNGQQRTVDRQEYATIALYHVMLTTVLIVDSVTWVVLWPMIKATTTGAELERLTRLMLCFTSYMQHGGNAVMVAVEFVLNDIPIKPYIMGYLGLWSAMFNAWAIFWYLHTGLWLYPFLNWHKPWAPFAYTGLFLLHWVFFGCVVGMQRVKERLLQAKPRLEQHLKEQ